MYRTRSPRLIQQSFECLIFYHAFQRLTQCCDHLRRDAGRGHQCMPDRVCDVVAEFAQGRDVRVDRMALFGGDREKPDFASRHLRTANRWHHAVSNVDVFAKALRS